ncbi:hypothetical protein TYRP_021515 [Tyrophagus putrescentiae]|nr:hypothetical protein TYRP_021515 [Tyrophagus putrescentiae]
MDPDRDRKMLKAYQHSILYYFLPIKSMEYLEKYFATAKLILHQDYNFTGSSFHHVFPKRPSTQLVNQSTQYWIWLVYKNDGSRNSRAEKSQ